MISISVDAKMTGQSSDDTIAKVLKWRSRVRFFTVGIIWSSQSFTLG